jgi:hypothetical protein
MCLLCQLVLVILFFVLPFLPRLFFLYTSCVLRGGDWFYYLSKKKINHNSHPTCGKTHKFDIYANT